MEDEIYVTFKKIYDDALNNKFNNKVGKKIGTKVDDDFKRVMEDFNELLKKKEEHVEARRKNREDNERRALIRNKKKDSQKRASQQDGSQDKGSSEGDNGNNMEDVPQTVVDCHKGSKENGIEPNGELGDLNLNDKNNDENQDIYKGDDNKDEEMNDNSQNQGNDIDVPKEVPRVVKKNTNIFKMNQNNDDDSKPIRKLPNIDDEDSEDEENV